MPFRTWGPLLQAKAELSPLLPLPGPPLPSLPFSSSTLTLQAFKDDKLQIKGVPKANLKIYQIFITDVLTIDCQVVTMAQWQQA